MKTAIAPLGEVCQINPATDCDFAPDEACSFVPMEAVDDIDARIAKLATRPFRELATGYTPFVENDVIVAKITPCMENGKCAIAQNLLNGVGFGSTEFHVLRATNHAIPEWLLYFWRFPLTIKRAAVNMTGSAGQKRVPVSFLQAVQIPLPGLSEQRRLVARLDHADRLRRLRRYSLGLTENFLRATFLNLFGHPVNNSKGWPVSELQELGSVERGKFTPRPRNDPSYYHGRFPFIQTGDISNCGGRLRSWTQTLNEKGIKVSRSFPPGTVVIAIVGATIGMTAILEVGVHCPDSVIGIQVNPRKATKEYIEFLLRFWRRVFLAQAPETARANINLDTVRPLRIPVPPLPLQQQFTALVDRAEHMRSVQHESLRQAEHLFQTLLYHAFARESVETNGARAARAQD